MPVRQIKKNYRNVTGLLASDKSAGEAQFESTLERDYLKILEFSPDVQDFEVQPTTIKWVDKSGFNRTYTPDVLVLFNQNLNLAPWLCEVKYRSDLKENWAEYYPKFKQGIRFARSHGWRFRLVTEVEVRGPELELAKLLLPFRRHKPEANKMAQVLSALSKLRSSTIQDLLNDLSMDRLVQAEWKPILFHLIATFQIGADFQAPITRQTKIWSLS